ncbi:CATRA conflict system CASPASE/TPR repeat-associated protein [Paractinoplanes globisporus]|uniref:CATRA conflict system CASPASE/TPR repeat-associated protein n=1 Tax=Paractinoplanes globisporus TaxID=113565 RepID=A0ABW6WPP2_9ACTN|nr:CATRA conflict system CASPASE/TPR repeat-associated protein [Actinoplanes globisporus]
MTVAGLVEPEFVAHLFAPLDGPNAAEALADIRRVWANCRDQLEMTQPIAEAGLPDDLPDDPASVNDGALAGLQDQAVRFQAIVRREHDVLNLSFAIAAPGAVPQSRPRLAASIPPGWFEFTRWWRDLGGEDAASLLGGATVYLAKTADASGVDLRAAVPAGPEDADKWWDSGITLEGFAAWEVTGFGTYASRRLILLAGLDEDVELSQFAWSDGGTSLPPLGRYLMHSAKIRYHARVRGDGQQLDRLRARAAGRLDEISGLLPDPGGPIQSSDLAPGLASDEIELAGAISALRLMRRSVDIARSNMRRSLPEPLQADQQLGDWLAEQLDDDVEHLEAVRERATRVHDVVTTTHRLPDPRPNAEPQVEYRVGFGIDVVSYSSRTTPAQREVQARVAAMAERVLADLGLASHETDRQPAGDGMMVVLPARVPAHVALPKLLNGWRTQVVADNTGHPEDVIRMRLSVGSGPFTVSAIGFSGQAIIEIGRLLDSAPLRRAMIDHPDTDLIALVADRLHKDVVVEGYPGLSADGFERVEVTVKSFSAPAWLWTGGRATARQTPAAKKPVGRDIFVIHGRDQRARADMFGLLRALDLHPLDWEEIVARTGKPAPYRDEVLAAGFAAGPGALVLLRPDEGSEVLMRTGRALALEPDRTILTEVGPVGPIPDLDGRETVRLDADSDDARTLFQHQVAQRLRILGYPVDTTGSDWLDPERFRGLT